MEENTPYPADLSSGVLQADFRPPAPAIAPDAPTPQLTTIEARYLLGAVLLTIIAVPAVWPFGGEAVSDALCTLGSYMLLGWLLKRHLNKTGISIGEILGVRPSNREIGRLLLLGIPLIAISFAALFAVYLPLSWVYPSFVTYYFSSMPPVIVWSLKPHAWFANALNVFILVLFAPVVEEIIFRGFLLNRWWHKYGLEKSIAWSSLVFGALHLELGAVVFALVLSRLYARNRSLLAPTLVHISNNLIVFIMVLAESVAAGETATFSLAEFQAYWWTAPLGLAIGLPWLAWFYHRYLNLRFVARSEFSRS